MKRKFIFAVLILIISTVIIQPLLISAPQYTGNRSCSSGWIEKIQREDQVQRNFIAYPTVHNITRLNDSIQILSEKILWQYYAYNGSYYEHWNTSKLTIYHLAGESVSLTFNVTVWISSSIEFCFNVTTFYLLDFIAPITGNETLITIPPLNDHIEIVLLTLLSIVGGGMAIIIGITIGKKIPIK